MAKRDELLQNFLENPILGEISGLSRKELADVSYSKKTRSILVEAMKRIISSSAEGDPSVTVIKSVNTVLEQHIKDAKK
jgi:hypothetical protein